VAHALLRGASPHVATPWVHSRCLRECSAAERPDDVRAQLLTYCGMVHSGWQETRWRKNYHRPRFLFPSFSPI